MDIELESGKYIVAVSGGVDSVVLLHLLRKLPDLDLAVAHFDHGIRSDSAEDRKFVQELAKENGLPFEYGEGKLGPNASEATARSARYEFLSRVAKQHRVQAIVTAHHQDDMLETAIINMLRGTGRKGLSSLDNNGKVERPLLYASKQQLLKYAKSQGLVWREDSTNQEEVYLRNYVRRRLLSKFSEGDKKKLLKLIKQSKHTNSQLDTLLSQEINQYSEGNKLDRQWFHQLPHKVALEVMAAWLRANDLRGFDRKALARLVVAAKTARPGQRFDAINGTIMAVRKDDLALEAIER
jgi:tRNA(Ile)-lysidine synthase